MLSVAFERNAREEKTYGELTGSDVFGCGGSPNCSAWLGLEGEELKIDANQNRYM